MRLALRLLPISARPSRGCTRGSRKAGRRDFGDPDRFRCGRPARSGCGRRCGTRRAPATVFISSRHVTKSCAACRTSLLVLTLQFSRPTMRWPSGHGNRGVDVGIEEGEERRADGDADRQSDAADQRQPRILHEHPRAELEVDAPVVQPAEGARVALVFLGLLDAAERAPRGEARVVAGHAFRDELVFEQLQVRRDFARRDQSRPDAAGRTTAAAGTKASHERRQRPTRSTRTSSEVE